MGESFEFGGIGGFIFLLQSDLMVWYWFKHRIRIGENFYFGGNSDELQGQTLKLLIQDVKWTVFSLFILHSEDVLFCQECDFLPVNFVLLLSSIFFFPENSDQMQFQSSNLLIETLGLKIFSLF